MGMKGNSFIGTDGELYVPFNDGSGQEAYIAMRDIEDMVLQTNGPNGLSRIIMEWKTAYPQRTKEDFLKQSKFTPETVDRLWD